MRVPFHKIILLILFTCHQAASQNWIWSSDAGNVARSYISRDPSNHFYLFGRSYWFGLSYPFNDTITKRDINGQIMWKYALPPGMYVTALVSPNSNGFYVGGNFTGTVTFAGTTYTASTTDIWYAKFDASSKLIWVKTIRSRGNDQLNDMCWSQNGLVMTGSIEDSASFDGMLVPKLHANDLFVAKFNANGILQQSKCSHVNPIYAQSGSAYGYECEADPSGNIYLIANAYGEYFLDTCHLSFPIPMVFMPNTTNIIKLNDSLRVQYVQKIQDCIWGCDWYSHLRVNSLGEVYYVDSYSYGQSGNDIDYSSIVKLDASGSYVGKYRPKPELKVAKVNDMQIDVCDNVYFTGFWRYYIYANPGYCSLIMGQLSPSMTLNWYWEDSTANNYVEGTMISLINYNDVLVTGTFADTLNLTGTIAGSPDYTDFMARFSVSGQKICANGVGINDNTRIEAPLIFPNPTTGRVTVPPDVNAIQVLNSTGQVVLTGEKAMDLSALPDGIYVLLMDNSKHQRLIQKIVVRK